MTQRRNNAAVLAESQDTKNTKETKVSTPKVVTLTKTEREINRRDAHEIDKVSSSFSTMVRNTLDTALLCGVSSTLYKGVSELIGHDLQDTKQDRQAYIAAVRKYYPTIDDTNLVKLSYYSRMEQDGKVVTCYKVIPIEVWRGRDIYETIINAAHCGTKQEQYKVGDYVANHKRIPANQAEHQCALYAAKVAKEREQDKALTNKALEFYLASLTKPETK